jgi:hypothetical protein
MKLQNLNRAVVSFLMVTALLFGITGIAKAATTPAILFYEDFTSSVYDLSGWVPVYLQENQGVQGNWYCGGQSVNFSSSRADGLQTRLEQPDFIELPADGYNLKLSFLMYHYLNNGKTDRLQVQILTENGGTWSNLENELFYRDLTYCQDFATTEGMYTHTISLDDYKGQKIKIGFLGISAVTDDDPYHIFIDEIYITSETASLDANLSGLTLSSGQLDQSFSQTTTSYTASVPNSVTSVTVTPIVNESHATVTINGNPASVPVNLILGDNTINVVVTAQDQVTTKTYTVKVTRTALIDEIKDTIISSNIPSISKSLASKVDAISDSLDHGNNKKAKNQLNAFINEVRAQSGKKIPVGLANDLIQKAQEITELL